MKDLIDRVRKGTAAIAALQPRVQAGEPWPLSTQFGTEPEASWGPPETLAHVAEMLPFWLGEIERILAGPAATPVPFGRVAADQLRIGIIERDRSLPVGELFARIEAGAARFTSRLSQLSAADAAREGAHPRLGPLTVRQVADRFVASHLEEHVEQLKAILAERH
ncbi:MAG TPA: DinB family protein [Candidatus Limnocylindrales bacterium]|jgi:hypothetical protein